MTRRITIDLTDAAEAEVQRLGQKLGLSTADLVRNSLSRFRSQTAVNHAVALFEHGWSVRWIGGMIPIEWRSPRGISGELYRSCSLDLPPDAVLKDARENGDYLSA